MFLYYFLTRVLIGDILVLFVPYFVLLLILVRKCQVVTYRTFAIFIRLRKFSLFLWDFLLWMSHGFLKMLFLHLSMWSCDFFFFLSVQVIDCIDCFSNIEPILHVLDKSCLVSDYNSFKIFVLNRFANILWRIFKSNLWSCEILICFFFYFCTLIFYTDSLLNLLFLVAF